MNNEITKAEIKDNSYFWLMYFKWFRGFDEEKEINLDEALEVIGIDQNKSEEWETDFFDGLSEENVKVIGGKLTDELSFYIEFQDCEIVFFLNDIYMGNLGGHFEAWFLTWDELLAFEKYELLFLLLLPMVGVELHQVKVAKETISKHLKTIPLFENEANYISNCIVNGLILDEPFFEEAGLGKVNNQNHSVRNLEKYPQHTADVKALNAVLNRFMA